MVNTNACANKLSSIQTKNSASGNGNAYLTQHNNLELRSSKTYKNDNIMDARPSVRYNSEKRFFGQNPNNKPVSFIQQNSVKNIPKVGTITTLNSSLNFKENVSQDVRQSRREPNSNNDTPNIPTQVINSNFVSESLHDLLNSEVYKIQHRKKVFSEIQIYFQFKMNEERVNALQDNIEESQLKYITDF